jgi:hypothetical protein
MKKINWKRLSFVMAIFAILSGNMIGISALATTDGLTSITTGADDPPDGVLVGYRPESVQIKTGEHIEYWGGWVGVPFAHLVSEYSLVMCCMKTNRSMDGCKGLKICNQQ